MDREKLLAQVFLSLSGDRLVRPFWILASPPKAIAWPVLAITSTEA